VTQATTGAPVARRQLWQWQRAGAEPGPLTR